MMQPSSVMVAIATVCIVVATALIINDHVTCFNIFGLAKGCAAH